MSFAVGQETKSERQMGKRKNIDVSEKIERRVVGVDAACFALNCGRDQLYALLSNNQIESYLDGRARRVTVESIDRYLARRGIRSPRRRRK